MEPTVHPMAPEHLPGFLPGPDGSDSLLMIAGVSLVLLVVLVGVLYFTLHALPERMGHRSNSTQLQLIGVLALLALFTHNTVYWVLALMLAAIRLPNIEEPLQRIARILEDRRDGQETR